MKLVDLSEGVEVLSYEESRSLLRAERVGRLVVVIEGRPEIFPVNYGIDGDGIIFPFGDMTGILREAGIPIREGLYDGNGAAFGMALDRPHLFLQPRWALSFSGDRIATAMLRSAKRGPHYQLVATIIVKGAPVVEIYHRDRGAIRPPPLCQEYIGQACAP